MKRAFPAILCVALIAAAPPAHAQQSHYNLRTMDFDLWCTEEQHLPYERCDQRLPEDVKKFEAYRAIVEKYEIPYLREKEDALQFNREVLHHDPIDDSVDKDVAAQSQAPQPTDGRSP
jgi:hypothetical protein